MKNRVHRTLALIVTAVILQFPVFAQTEIQNLIRGEKGITASFTRLSPDKQIAFTPAQAKTLLGIDKSADLVLKNTETDQLGEVHYRYYQTYKGIPVENTMYIMHSKNGLLKGMNGSIVLNFSKEMGLPTATNLKSGQAIQSALSYVNAKIYAWQMANMEEQIKDQTGNSNATYYPATTLVWYSTGNVLMPENLRLAYKVDVYAKEPLSRAYYYVDAKTGEVLGKKNQLFHTDAIGTANTVYSGTQTIHSDLFGSSYRLRDYTKGNGVITKNGNSGADYTNSTPDWVLSGTNRYALDVHYGVSQTYNFYKTVFNRNSVDGLGYALTSYANESSTFDNAYWDGFSMHFGISSSTGGGIDAIDIVGHELTHGVTQYTSDLDYLDEPGAINESMSDIMGKSVQFWSKPADINWTISNDMGWYIRNMANPNQMGHPDTYHGLYWYSGGNDYGGVHTNSGVGNFMFYLLVTGGSGTNDIGNAYTVTGIGLTEADAILYRAGTVYLSTYSQYIDWRVACISAATDLYGGSSNEVLQVQNAFYAVGIGTVGALPCSGTPTPGTISPSAPVICSGATTTLALSGYTTGKNGITFQWKSSPDNISFSPIPGATNTTYSTSALSATTYYTCVVSCSAGSSATSNVVTVTVNPNATAYSVTGGGTYCSGGIGVPIDLSGSQSGVNYQLKNGGANAGSSVPGTGSSISFGNQTAAGTYTIIATNGNGCTKTMTGSAIVSVSSLPTATITASGSIVICSGNSVTLNSNIGTGYSYQWQKNGGIIPAATASTYAAASADTFTCVVTNSCGSATSNKIVITVTGSAPVAEITAAGPVNICTGSFVTLNANTGTGLSYQWKLNGVNLTGATSSSYAAASTGNYTCLVGNGCSTKLSNIIAINVVGRNTLVLQPNAANGMDAAVSSLSANANTNFGTSPNLDAFAWTFSGTPGVERGYICFDLSSIPSTAIIQQATLSLYNNPTSGNNGGQHSNLSGSNAAWIQKITAAWNENTITWNNKPPVTSTNRVAIPQSTDTHQNYIIFVTNLIQDMVSNPATNYGMMIQLQTESYYRALIFASSDNEDSTKWPKLSVTYSNVFINAAGPTSVCQGDTVHLNSFPADTGTTFQWQLNGTEIPGATSSSYAATLAGSYKCIISDSCGSSPSNTIAVTVNAPPPAVITSTGGSLICNGSFILLSANTGTGLTYQWQMNGSNLPGVTAPNMGASKPGTYTCLVSNAYCHGIISNSIPIYIAGKRNTLTLQPNATTGADAVISNLSFNLNTNMGTSPNMNGFAWTFGGTPGTERSFIRFDLSSVPANATVQQATLSLYNNPTSENNGGQHSNLSGSDAAWLQRVTAAWNENTLTWSNQPATTSTNQVAIPQSTDPHQDYNLDITTLVQGMVTTPATNYGLMLRLQNEGYYRALIFASSDNADSTKWPKLAVTYYLPLIPLISSIGSSEICVGDSLTMTASPLDTGYSYQWKLNGDSIPNAVDPSYTATSTGIYTCVIKDSCGSAPSNAIALSVDTKPSAFITSGDSTTICSGSSANLEANAGNGWNYQWQIDGVDISGATSSSYAANTQGSYATVVSNGGCQATSNTIEITVNALPVASISAGSAPTTFCSGEVAMLDANTGSGLSYQWELDGGAIPDATLSSYPAGEQGSYLCIVSDGNCQAPSNTISIIVNTLPTATINMQGGNALVTSCSTADCNYEWHKDGNPTGTNSDVCLIAGNGNYAVTITDANGCTAISDPFIVTGIENNFSNLPAGQAGAFEIFPNPSHDYFTLKNVFSKKDVTFQITNALGQVVYADALNGESEKRINIKLAEGIYLLRITEANTVYSQKLVIE